MRIPALAVAGALAFAAASPALAATTTVTAVSPLEQLLHDVSVSRTVALDTIEKADGDEELIREAFAQWRADLLDAADREAELRKDAEKRSPELTPAQAKAYNDAETKIKADRADLRELHAELLPDDPAIVLPESLRRLGGLVDIVAADAVERDAEQSGKVIQYGIPGIGAVEAEDEVAAPAVTTPSVALTPAPVTPAPAQPKPSYRVERLQETSPSTTTETTTSSNGESTTSTTTGETTAATTTTAETTTSATTSWTSTIMQNRTTSATSTTSSSTTSSTYSTTSSSTTTSSYDDDDERDDDLAETGTPMLSLIVLGALATLAGLLLMRRPS